MTGSMKVFRDRVDAGGQLARKLARYKDAANCIVLALPRGGVPVAAVLAHELNLPLDVLVVRKLGAPGQPELAMGAIASGGAVAMNPEVRDFFADQTELIEDITRREQAELKRREHAYRGDRAPLAMHERTAIVVDDGAATGATMRAAVQALRILGAKRVVVALPVASDQAIAMLDADADEVLCLETPSEFYAVGQWYSDFDQTTDEEVRELLARARRA
jgi:putative phosphoribosyl transferase